MLQALLRGKLDRWLRSDAYSIEDLLTSVVLGSAGYATPEEALLPFLREASDQNGRTLADSLRDVVDVELSFWPRWSALEEPGAHSPASELDENVRESGLALDEGEDEVESENEDAEPTDVRVDYVTVSASEPEVVVSFTHADGHRSMVLIEAKLHSGKSSHGLDRASVNDQLAKYWLQLKQRTDAEGARPLGVIYLTTASVRPEAELQASQEDLASSGLGPAPLYWLSWRTFYDVVGDNPASPLLRDCVRLLVERWNLVTARVEPWSEPPRMPGRFEFTTRFTWPRSTALSTWTYRETES